MAATFRGSQGLFFTRTEKPPRPRHSREPPDHGVFRPENDEGAALELSKVARSGATASSPRR